MGGQPCRIAMAVEEQSISAKEISEVNQASDDIANSSSKVRLSAGELSALAEQLNEMVGRFKV